MKDKKGIFLAILAALCYSISSPLSKLLLNYVSPTLMAGFLYLGAGLGMLIILLINKLTKTHKKESKLTKKDLPYVILMVILDIIAPVLLMFGLRETSASNASLLNNFEIVMTSLIALIIFKEKITPKVWIGIITITIACVILSIDSFESFNFQMGSLLILLASLCWGLENNCTKKISNSDPLEIVLIKGLFSGTGSIILGFSIGERISVIWPIFIVLLVGIIAYGLSIFFYVYAQRYIGAAKTSAFYAINPFIASILSLIIFLELPNYQYYIALAIMVIGCILVSMTEKKKYNYNKDLGIFRYFRPPFSIIFAHIGNLFLNIIGYFKLKDRRFNITKIKKDFKAYLIRNKDSNTNKVLIYLHGGGLLFKAAPYHYNNIKKYVKSLDIAVFMIDYRVLKSNKSVINDARKAIDYLIENKELYNIDINNMIIGGDSIGGFLVTQLITYYSFKGIFLIYPVLDSRCETSSMNEYVDTPMWNSSLNQKMVNKFIKKEIYIKDIDKFTKTYIEVAEFDCLHDEGINLANALGDKLIYLNETKGTIHGFDIKNNETTRNNLNIRLKYLKEMLGD